MSLVFDTETNTVARKEEVVYDILNHKTPFLRKVCTSFDFNNHDAKVLKENFISTMNRHPCVGLSAPQVGIDARFFVIRHDSEHKYLCVINPEILSVSEIEVPGNESCLSDMFLLGNVKRPKWVEVKFLDENEEVHVFTFEDESARIFLHEYDHLNGKLFTDYMGPVALKLARDKQAKFLKKLNKLKK